MNKITLKIFLPVLLISFVLLFLIIFAVNNSKPEKKIEGHWVLSEISENDYSGAYPEKELYFFKDGTYTTNRYQNGTYSMDGNLITIRYLFDAYTYQYKLQKNTLALKWIEEDEDDPFIYYEKVDGTELNASANEETTALTKAKYDEEAVNLLVDDSDLFTKSEKEELSSMLETIHNEYKFDIVIHTTDTFDGKDAQNYADDYYDNNGYGYGVEKDGCIFVINTEQREWYISTCGSGITLLNDKRLKSIEKSFTANLKRNEYFDAVTAFINSAKKYL